METTAIQIQGIKRNQAKGDFADGDCQEIINMRLRDGAWSVRKRPEKTYANYSGIFTVVAYHDQDNVQRWVGYLPDNGSGDGELRLIDMANSDTTVIKTYIGGLTTIRIEFLKRFMLVITPTGIDKFIFKNGAYTLVNIIYQPKLSFASNTVAPCVTETATTAEALLGKYKKMLIELNQQWGNLEGGIMLRYAYKLFDGTFIYHSLPIYHEIAPLLGEIRKTGANYDIRFLMSSIYAVIDRSYYQAFEGMKDIINSICIFACKNERFYQVDDSTITDTFLATITGSSFMFGGGGTPTTSLAINNNFKKMADASGWYLVHEIPFTQACNIYAGTTETIDLKGFQVDYAARQVLPVDNFSYHSIMGKESFIYNDRLMMGGITTVMGNPFIKFQNTLSWETYILDTGFPVIIYLIYTISTDAGVIYKTVEADGGFLYRVSGAGAYYSILDNRILGYPDARATSVKLVIFNSPTYFLIQDFALTKSVHDNYAYYNDPNFDATKPTYTTYNFAKIIIPTPLTTTINMELYPDGTILDNNRIQVSELRNPYYFPAKLSYQVGTGEIIGLCSNTEPISQGQFGQYPLYVFTTKGIWMLEQGSGSVLFAAVSPALGDVALSSDQIVGVGAGVVFVTARGVFLIAGKEKVEISQSIEGQINTDFVNNSHFDYFVDHASLVELSGSLSTVDALTYILGAIVGFNKVDNEIIFSNPDYDYSYVFSLETNTWHKFSFTFDLFVNNYPYLMGIMQGRGYSNGVYTLGLEEASTVNEVLIVTQPQSITLHEIFKKIERAVLRCLIQSSPGCYITFAVWATDDLKTYQFITGGQRTGLIQNILLTRSHNSNKYYVFMVAAKMGVDSQISSIDVSVTPRLTRKLRA
jgi:hypothetical protein